MRGSKLLAAQLSQTVYHSKRAFEKQLDYVPSTAFHYYYQTKVKELQENSAISSSRDILSFAQYNNAFKRYIRKEWQLLSGTKRRLYYAFFFHFTKLDYKKLNKYELARIMEISTPAISEYMLFRNKFKDKFDIMWHEKNLMSERKKNIIVRCKSKFTNQRVTVISNKQKDHLVSVSNSDGGDDITNLTKRFRHMCRECRAVWDTCITDNMKLEIKNKLRDQKRQFELQLQYERTVLDYNLEKLSHTKIRHNLLCIERPVSHTTVDTTSPMALPFTPNKKK